MAQCQPQLQWWCLNHCMRFGVSPFSFTPETLQHEAKVLDGSVGGFSAKDRVISFCQVPEPDVVGLKTLCIGVI